MWPLAYCTLSGGAGARADAAGAVDENLELIGLVEMGRRHGARRLGDEEALRHAVVVDLVALLVVPAQRHGADELTQGVVLDR